MGNDPDLRKLPESRLIQWAAAGRAAAVGVLYDRYARELYGLAFRLTGSESDAWDVVHDVFAGLPEALSSVYEEQGRLRSWLLKVTRRTALLKLRRRKRWCDVLFILPRPSDRAVTEDRCLDRIVLQRAIEELRPEWKAVLVLRVEGLSHAEIGETLGITRGASRMRFCRARKEMKSRLAKAQT